MTWQSLDVVSAKKKKMREGPRPPTHWKTQGIHDSGLVGPLPPAAMEGCGFGSFPPVVWGGVGSVGFDLKDERPSQSSTKDVPTSWLSDKYAWQNTTMNID